MKFCTKCGLQLSDNMAFCPRCGNKSEPFHSSTHKPQPPKSTPQATPSNGSYLASEMQKSKSSNVSIGKGVRIRVGMAILTILCFVVSGFLHLLSIFAPPVFPLALFTFILGLMFMSLGLVPKESKVMYFLGKPCKLKKGLFVLLSLILAFTLFAVSTVIIDEKEHRENSVANNSMQKATSSETVDSEQNTPSTTQTNDTTIGLQDIKVWYTNQTAAISQSLIEYASTIDGLSSLNVDSSSFKFGENLGWYDCHYTFYFTCKINDITYNGEARAFMEYQSDTVNWFHFEVFSNDDNQSIVEHYDDSYDQIIEAYYKELENQYK